VLAISLASPADLLITDAQGNKLGFDSQTQTEKYEIENGIYSGRDELELAAIINPPTGKYIVSIIGNGEGEFNTGITYASENCNKTFDQDNFGQTTTSTITMFTVYIENGCSENTVSYFLNSIIDIDPDTLNISSNGKYITAYIELPNSYNIENIDTSTIMINNKIPALISPTKVRDHNKNGIKDLMVKFKRKDVYNVAGLGNNILTINGNLFDGTKFGGEDNIRVIKSNSE